MQHPSKYGSFTVASWHSFMQGRDRNSLLTAVTKDTFVAGSFHQQQELKEWCNEIIPLLEQELPDQPAAA